MASTALMVRVALASPMKCYLHVGVEKTGTTTVQEFLHLNRELLTRRGCLFTSVAGERNNWKLPVAAYDHDQRDDLTRLAAIVSDSDLADFRHQLEAGLSTAIENARGNGCRSVIISSEHLQSRLQTDTSLKRLASILEAVGITEVVVVVYLRDPAALVGSLYSTIVKSGSTGVRPPGPDDAYFNRACNHRQTLEQFAATFGAGAVVPRIFEPETLVGGSIIDDLLDVVGMDAAGAEGADLARPPQLNERLSTTAVEVLRRVNHFIPLVVDGATNPARAGLVEILEGIDWGSKYRVDAETARQYSEAFAESNEWVRSRYFPDRPRLFACTSEDSAVDGSPAAGLLGQTGQPARTPADLNAMAALVAELWIDRQRAGGLVVDSSTLDTRKLVERSGLFDAEFYLRTYPAVAAAGIDPLTHFLERGGAEGRQPSSGFDTRAYVAANPGVAERGENPLVHYLAADRKSPSR